MIQLRGGFHGLNDNLRLFASWFDVVGSATKDTPPRLAEDSSFHLPFAERAGKGPLLGEAIEELTQVGDDSGNLVSALEEVAAVCHFVNLHSLQPGFWRQENDLSSLWILGPATHLLLSMTRFEDFNPSCFQFVHEMVRLSLLILLAGLKQFYELAAPEMDLLQGKLYNLLKQGSPEKTDFYLFPKLQTWALATASLFQAPGSRMDAYTKEISRRMPACEFPNGASVLNYTSNILWIECLTDPPFLESLAFSIEQARSPPG